MGLKAFKTKNTYFIISGTKKTKLDFSWGQFSDGFYWRFFGGSTQKTHWVFFGHVAGCLNPDKLPTLPNNTESYSNKRMQLYIYSLNVPPAIC